MKLMRRLLAVAAIVSAAAPAVASDEKDCFGPGTRAEDQWLFGNYQRVPTTPPPIINRAVAVGWRVISTAPSRTTPRSSDGSGQMRAPMTIVVARTQGESDTHAVEDVTKAHELMAKATAQPITITPKAPKTSKVTSNAPNATKRKATLTPKAGTNVSKAAPGSNFWSWLNPWTDSADQVGGKNAKP
jgi:hypothetical protein